MENIAQNSATNRRTIAVLDTTVQIDRRVKSRQRAGQISQLIAAFDETLATGLTAVEFKAVFIQELITIHNQLRRKGAKFTHVRANIQEKNHPQARLRGHIFHNLLVYGVSSFDISDEQDEELARKARLKLEDTIPACYEWFRNESATVYLNQQSLACNRADEPPKKDGAAFPANLPNCKRGKNKTCRVEEVIRKKWPAVKDRLPVLDAANAQHDQLIKQSTVLDSVCRDPSADLSVGECRRAGDSLILLEILTIATHSVSTNSREWSVLSQASGLEFVEVRYEGEETQ